MNPLSSLLCMLIIAKEIGIALLVKIRSAFRRKTACFSRVSHIPCPPAPTLARKKGNLLVLLWLVRVNYGHSALYPSSTLPLPMPRQPL